MTCLVVAETAAGLLGAMLTAWCALRRPEWAVALALLTVPLQGFATVGSASTGITWTQAWLWTFLAVALALFASGRIVVTLDAPTLAFVAVVACYALSIRAAQDEALWRNEVYRWTAALAFFLLVRAMLRGRPALVPLVVAAAAGALWTGAVAAVQVLTDVGPASFERGGSPRAYASFGEPNTFGAYAAGSALALAAVAAFGWRSLPIWLRLTALAGLVSGLLGVGLSQSRGASLAVLVVAAAGGLLWLHRRLPASSHLRGVVVAAGVTVAVVLVPPVVDRVLPTGPPREVTSATWADGERAAHWRAATAMVVDSGGLGIGAGQFDLRYREQTPTWRFRIPQGHAHNAYLQVAAEAGLAALGAYLVMLTTVVLALVRRARSVGSPPLAVGALAVTVGFALHNMVDYLHVLNLPIVLVAWWAAALGQSEGSTAAP